MRSISASERNHVPDVSEIALLRLGLDWSMLAPASRRSRRAIRVSGRPSGSDGPGKPPDQSSVSSVKLRLV